MSFIDVTRYGGLRTLRVAVAAIAYLDVAVDGAVVHLIGGEVIRVNEDIAEIEARCAPAPPPTMIVAIEPEASAPPAPAPPADAAPPIRKGRR